MVRLTGFHGTLQHKAENIIQNGFIHSKKDTEWLGFGVYFFTKKQDAKKWALLEADKDRNKGSSSSVLQCSISCEDNEYFDLDNRKNMSGILSCVSSVFEGLAGRNSTKISDERQLRCIACNYFAKKYGIKVYAYTFPGIKNNKIGFPFVLKQRQICVRSDECIKDIREC